MNEKVENLILEHLRALRTDISQLRDGVRELKEGQISIRDEIHSIRGDILRQERAIASLEVDIDRIKRRLDLTDEEPPRPS